MSVPLGNVNGRNLVIASVGTSVEPSINYQESQEIPTERPNGGDLLPGDLWYDNINDVLYVYTTLEWKEVSNDNTPQIELLDESITELTNRVTSLEQDLMATNYTIDGLSIKIRSIELDIQDIKLRLTAGGL